MSRDQDARAQITLTLSDEPLNSVILEETAYDVWQTLCGRYEGTGQQTIAQVIGELFQNTLADDSPMQPQLAAMRQKAQLIRNLGQALDDSLVAAAMLISLPSSFFNTPHHPHGA